MDIASLKYVALLVISVVIHYKLPSRFRILYLVILSCGFIANLNIYLPLYLILYVCINFYLGLKISISKWGRLFYYIGIIVNLFQLLIIRYASFAIDPLLVFLGSGFKLSLISEIILPIGISYYTLQ